MEQQHVGLQPAVSVIINTDGRAHSLASTLTALRYLDYPRFEVCVVSGPTKDGTEELLGSWQPQLKVASCPLRNLSVSRNIGIALGAGPIVAFIDDDAIPEPEWLRELVAPYSERRVGASGGFVYDHTGVEFQYRFATANRLGQADLTPTSASPELCFPFTANFPHLIGTNNSFRREALLSIGGFDEEFDYYLDETDVCCRLVDAGWLIAQVPGAYVHHKYLPSDVRNESRILKQWYSVVKNKIYFSLKNSRGHHGMQAIMKDAQKFIDRLANDVEHFVERGDLTTADRDNFRKDVDRAWRDGLMHGLSSGRKLMRSDERQRSPARFLPFKEDRGEERRTYCFLTQEYPPTPVGGIGRYVHHLARAVASSGHHVHVMTSGTGRDRLDFEDGVWVHRTMPRRSRALRPPSGMPIPPRIWDYATTMLSQVEAIAERRRVDCVVAPIWDAEGIAILVDGRFPLVTSLHTTFNHWLESQPWRRADKRFMADFAFPLIEAETQLLAKSMGLVANSVAIVSDIERRYGVELARKNIAMVPHGLDDWSVLPFTEPAPLPAGAVRLLFVGRLEARKGVDVLLEVATDLLLRHAFVYLDLAGNDKLPAGDGSTYRAKFESDSRTQSVASRVTFHGEIDDKALRGLYRRSDIVVVPSRFESFGLTLIEGMMFGKAVVACAAGGMSEVVDDQVTGLLALPGDTESLREALEQLICDRQRRELLGANARQKYLSCFTAERMAESFIAFLSRTREPRLGTLGSSMLVAR